MDWLQKWRANGPSIATIAQGIAPMALTTHKTPTAKLIIKQLSIECRMTLALDLEELCLYSWIYRNYEKTIGIVF